MSQHIKENREKLLLEQLQRARKYHEQRGTIDAGEVFTEKHLKNWPDFRQLNSRKQGLLLDKLKEYSK